jgi:D-sedoheptulose 7-phosphate isomerase
MPSPLALANEVQRLIRPRAMDIDAFFDAQFSEHMTVAQATAEDLRAPFRALVDVCAAAVRGGHKVMFFGNGGSAADAQHLATELTVRFAKDRAPIAGLALTTDSSALTAIGNDLGFEELFARQIAALGKPGDVAIGITTSGNSANVVRALKTARGMGLTAAALTGNKGGAVKGVADPVLIVPSDITARIQEMHITLGQMLCAALERELGLV